MRYQPANTATPVCQDLERAREFDREQPSDGQVERNRLYGAQREEEKIL